MFDWFANPEWLVAIATTVGVGLEATRRVIHRFDREDKRRLLWITATHDRASRLEATAREEGPFYASADLARALASLAQDCLKRAPDLPRHYREAVANIGDAARELRSTALPAGSEGRALARAAMSQQAALEIYARAVEVLGGRLPARR